MLAIRFSRIGKRKKPFYKIIISEKEKTPRSRYLELLGHYNPHTKDTSFNTERIQYWLSKGATVSTSVFNLFVKHKLVTSDEQRRSVFISKKRAAQIAEKKKKEEADRATAAETPVPAETEALVEEAAPVNE